MLNTMLLMLEKAKYWMNMILFWSWKGLGRSISREDPRSSRWDPLEQDANNSTRFNIKLL